MDYTIILIIVIGFASLYSLLYALAIPILFLTILFRVYIKISKKKKNAKKILNIVSSNLFKCAISIIPLISFLIGYYFFNISSEVQIMNLAERWLVPQFILTMMGNLIVLMGGVLMPIMFPYDMYVECRTEDFLCLPVPKDYNGYLIITIGYVFVIYTILSLFVFFNKKKIKS